MRKRLTEETYHVGLVSKHHGKYCDKVKGLTCNQNVICYLLRTYLWILQHVFYVIMQVLRSLLNQVKLKTNIILPFFTAAFTCVLA